MYKKQNETKVQRQIQDYIRSIGGYCFKVHGEIFMRAGIPDIICCIKGKFVGIECKDGDNSASSLQIGHRSPNYKIRWTILYSQICGRCKRFPIEK